MPQPTPSPFTASEELLRVAQEYADLFNASPPGAVEHLIADACVDPFWDDRTNLLSLLADGPESLGLVLATDGEDYVTVRFVDRWVVDTSAVDWEELEARLDEQDFDPDEDDGYDETGED